MKKLYLLVLCAMASMLATAQVRPSWSVELGLGVSSWMGDGADGSNAIFNQRIGVGIDIPLTGLVSFQTGLNWTSKGARHKMGGSDKRTVNQNYFEMPLLAAFHIGTPKNFDVVIAGGGYIACGVAGKTQTDVDDVTFSWSTFKDVTYKGNTMEGMRRFDAGIQAGVDLDFSHYIVGIDGEFGLARIWEGGPRNYGVFATVGYKF